jgi:uncharacterized NAD-dependent epimerase/dehydratase family protein
MHIKPRMENPIESKTLLTKKQWEQKHKDNIVQKKKALVYCEKQFGLVDGKTAAALVRHSEIYSIVGIIDSSLAGKDAGEELGEEKNGIPIFADLESAIESLSYTPDCYIYGKAPLETFIPKKERLLILEAMINGMDIVSGLHEFFTQDPELSHIAALNGVQIKDIRKPPALKDLHLYTGQIAQVNVPVIAVLGTDCACGKMTTAVELNKTLNQLGIKSVLVATGQTSLMQGAKYGVSTDALISQFLVGEVENSVVQAFKNESPDIILVEGQSAISHPAFLSSTGILKGSMPDGVILQHPPARKFRCDFPDLAMPTPESEIKLIETVSKAKVIAITLSHEDLNEQEVLKITEDYELQLRLPTTDVLSNGCQKLVQALSDQFPKLGQKIKLENSKFFLDKQIKGNNRLEGIDEFIPA